MNWRLLTSLLVLASTTSLNAAPTHKTKTPEVIPGEYIVKLKKGAGNIFLNAFSGESSATQFRTDQSLFVVKSKSGKAIKGLLANPAVEYVEPNYILRTQDISNPATVTPNDPDLEKTWGLLNKGQNDPKGNPGLAGSDIGATKAWAITKGSRKLVVAIIDTGVDYTHEDVRENIFTNTKEIPGNGIDDDGNGFIDDVHGWNFSWKAPRPDPSNPESAPKTPTLAANDPMDDNGHGTHCAGTIGGVGDNGIGVTGVNWQVSILPVKFLTGEGSGSLADAVDAINYSTKMGVNVMSNSWGGGGFSQTMFDAIKAAKDKGILFVAAAGNDTENADVSPMYPAGYQVENIISVAATDNRDQLASFSNYGAKSVHLSAPGVNIWSSVPEAARGKKYDSFSGTSMATPHVSGAAALLWSANEGMTYADIKARLLATVDPVRGLRRKTITGGRLNVYNALTNTIPPRNEPPADAWKSYPVSLASDHPYKDGANVSFQVSHPGAKYIRLHFTKVSTEEGYDILRIKAKDGSSVENLSGKLENYTTDYAEGSELNLRFTSDMSQNDWGYEIDRYEVIE